VTARDELDAVTFHQPFRVYHMLDDVGIDPYNDVLHDLCQEGLLQRESQAGCVSESRWERWRPAPGLTWKDVFDQAPAALAARILRGMP
jgi:hypothetical protein